MKVVLIPPKQNAPESLLANAELHGFITKAPNIKIVDIAIWNGDKGPWVAFPGRQYQSGDGKKKTARFVRPIGDDWTDLNRVQEFILAEWKKWQAAREAAGPDADSQGFDDSEVPFA